MASRREFPGLGQGDALVKPVAGVSLSAVRLTAQEGFVYSRVDGSLSLEALCLVTGLGEEATSGILRRLLALGLIELGAAERPRRLSAEQRAASPAAPTAPEARRPADTARTEIPSRRSPSDESVPRAEARRRRPPSDETERTAIPEKRRSPSDEATFPPEQTGPARPRPKAVQLPADESGIDLKPEQRVRIREIFSTLQERNFFELLEVSPHADATEVKRAYYLRSKEFHPDRYYTKKLGAYKEMLDEIFKQVSAAYRFLEDDEQRGSYREMVLQDMEQASALRQVEQQAAMVIGDEGDGSPGPDPEAPASTPAELESEPDHEYSMSRSDIHRAVGEETPTRAERPRRPSPFAPRLPTPPPPVRADETGSYAKLSPEERAERERRREEDRKRRMSSVTSTLLGRSKRAQTFYEQGLRQLAANQVLAAAASLKLAVTFGGDAPQYRRAYDEAVEKSRTLTAENYYKRGIFEESVGRMELAGKHFIQAAEALPTKALYLYRAAEALLASQDLIKAKDYATRAVQVDGSSVDARVALARVYDAVGMSKNARRELQHALKLDPGNTQVKDLLKGIRG